MQQPPPQFSPDGLYWWDGARWVPRALPPYAPAPQHMYQPPAPLHQAPPSPWPSATVPWYAKPSPGLRIVLVIFLVLELLAAGLFAVVFAFAAVSGGQDLLSYGLGLYVLLTFVVSGAALVAVVLRAQWSRWMAIAAGILICWWVVGALIGLPILVLAARAPDMGRAKRA